MQLELIDYYYLVVRSYRAGVVAAEYVLDLRFVEASLPVSRHFASRWLLCAPAFLALAGAIAFWRDAPAASGGWLAATGIVLGIAIAATVIGLYRTTETVSMCSVHGRARVFEFTSGLGLKKSIEPFTKKLVAHIKFATAARRPLKSEHLRDEMREHFRLRESGVLSAEDYESSKTRILAEHGPNDSPDGLTASQRRVARLAPDMSGGWY